MFAYFPLLHSVCLPPSFQSFHQPRTLVRSPRLSFIQTVVSLLLSTVALLSSYWCEGRQKIPKPLCSPTKQSNCIPVPGMSNSSNIQFFWETGDDRFVFPAFHTGLFMICEENIHTDEWGKRMEEAGLLKTESGQEKCRGFYHLTPGSEKAMMWLCLSLELVYIGLLLISCTLLSVQLCIRAWCPSTQRWGQLLNAFAAVFTVLGGAPLLEIGLGMIRTGFNPRPPPDLGGLLRSARDGGTHDVHAGVSDHRLDGAGRLQTSQLRILLGFLVSSDIGN
uniref:Germ cell associated 1 n=1 Tax=Salarias fasciatus TaxID=181472 RepID=A0A672IVK4_SALFA